MSEARERGLWPDASIVREDMGKLGLTSQQLAHEANLSLTTVKRLLSGRHPTSRSTLEDVARVCRGLASAWRCYLKPASSVVAEFTITASLPPEIQTPEQVQQWLLDHPEEFLKWRKEYKAATGKEPYVLRVARGSLKFTVMMSEEDLHAVEKHAGQSEQAREMLLDVKLIGLSTTHRRILLFTCLLAIVAAITLLATFWHAPASAQNLRLELAGRPTVHQVGVQFERPDRFARLPIVIENNSDEDVRANRICTVSFEGTDWDHPDIEYYLDPEPAQNPIVPAGGSRALLYRLNLLTPTVQNTEDKPIPGAVKCKVLLNILSNENQQVIATCSCSVWVSPGQPLSRAETAGPNE
ncbi:helix-turn-helix domain-containing protein [Planctomycetaceae bacterium SH139]